jgi:cysteine-rich repeat protein
MRRRIAQRTAGAMLLAIVACTNDYDSLDAGGASGGASSAPAGVGGAGTGASDGAGAAVSSAATTSAAGGSAGGGVGGGAGGGGASGGGPVGGAGGGPPCGDGTVDATTEECDDGGTVPGDGCSQDCVVECDGPQTAKHPDTKHCYRYLNASLVQWQPGRELCQALGPSWDLAVVTTSEERDFLDDVLDLPVGPQFENDDPFQYWLGAQIGGSGDFEWLSGELWEYTPWDSGQPDGDGQNCLRLRALDGDSNDAFRDADCDLTCSALCELQPAGTAP